MENFRDLNEQIREIKEQLANMKSQRVSDGENLSFSLTNSVEDTTNAGIDNATFSSASPQCLTVDESLGK